MHFRTNPQEAQAILNQLSEFLNILNTLDWAGNPQLAENLQASVLNSAVDVRCRQERVRELHVCSKTKQNFLASTFSL